MNTVDVSLQPHGMVQTKKRKDVVIVVLLSLGRKQSKLRVACALPG